MTTDTFDREALLALFDQQGSGEGRQLVEQALAHMGCAEQAHFSREDLPRIMQAVVAIAQRQFSEYVPQNAEEAKQVSHAGALLDALNQHAFPMVIT